MPVPTPCALLTGSMKTACEKAQSDVRQSNTVAGTGQQASLFDIITGKHSPLDWRHVAIRGAEIVIGLALVVVGVSALAKSNSAVKVVVDQAKKGAKQI